jgi:hypothetical protein
MAETKARRTPDRGPSHPGAVLDDIMPSLGKPKAGIARLLGISRQRRSLEVARTAGAEGAARAFKDVWQAAEVE